MAKKRSGPFGNTLPSYRYTAGFPITTWSPTWHPITAFSLNTDRFATRSPAQRAPFFYTSRTYRYLVHRHCCRRLRYIVSNIVDVCGTHRLLPIALFINMYIEKGIYTDLFVISGSKHRFSGIKVNTMSKQW